MTRTFSDRHPKVLPACNFLSQYYFYDIFLQKSCRFSLQTLTKFEAAKTGSGVGFLRLIAVWSAAILVPRAYDPSGLWQGSRALAWVCAEHSFRILDQSDLMGSPWIADFRCKTKPELWARALSHTAVKRKNLTPLPVFAASNFVRVWRENLQDFCRKML